MQQIVAGMLLHVVSCMQFMSNRRCADLVDAVDVAQLIELGEQLVEVLHDKVGRDLFRHAGEAADVLRVAATARAYAACNIPHN